VNHRMMNWKQTTSIESWFTVVGSLIILLLRKPLWWHFLASSYSEGLVK
jgi:hypothetical protein